MKSYSHIYVAVATDENLDSLLQKSIALAKLFEAKVTYAHVIDVRSFELASRYDRNVLDQLKENALHFLEKLKERAEAEGVSSDISLMIGHNRKTLLEDINEESRPDLVLCGAHAVRDLESFFTLGSVSHSLANRANCDVLIVK